MKRRSAVFQEREKREKKKQVANFYFSFLGRAEFEQMNIRFFFEVPPPEKVSFSKKYFLVKMIFFIVIFFLLVSVSAPNIIHDSVLVESVSLSFFAHLRKKPRLKKGHNDCVEYF